MKMPTIQIEVNVPEMTEEEIRLAIIARATDLVLGTETTYDEDGEVMSTALDIGSYRKAITEESTKAVREMVNRIVPPIIEEIVRSPFIPTNQWGEKKGTPTTLREIVAETAKGWLLEKVNSRGERDSYREDTRERIVWLVRTETEEVWKKTIADEVSAIGKMIREEYLSRIQAQVAAVIAKVVKP
jgi:hypothetical protein